MTMPIVGPEAIFNFTSITGDSLIAKAIKGFKQTANSFLEKAGSGVVNYFSKDAVKVDISSPETPKTEGTFKWPSTFEDIAPLHPYICELSIGKIFKKDYMVVKNFDVTFSKEYFQEGWPLYADYTVTLESLFNSANQMNSDKDDIFGTGFKRDKLFRVTVTDDSKGKSK